LNVSTCLAAVAERSHDHLSWTLLFEGCPVLWIFRPRLRFQAAMEGFTIGSVNTWSKTKLLGAAIVVGGFLLGKGYICFSTAGPPYQDALWCFNRIGGVVIYGT
jgi:hypothetical protein